MVESHNGNELCGRRLVKEDALASQLAGAKRVEEYGGWPWMAFVDQRGSSNGRRSNLYCGGTLVDEMTVVTAAHCLQSVDTDDVVSVWLGLLDRVTDNLNFTQSFLVPYEKIKIHSGYGKSEATYDSDIAVLKLDKPANFSYFVHPICVPGERLQRNLLETYERERRNFVVTGWGKNEKGDFSENLMKTRLGFVSRDTCDARYRAEGFGDNMITNNMICAGFDHVLNDACKGDSGGPLMTNTGNKGDRKWYLSGVVSFGDERNPDSCGKARTPGGYTDVGKFEDFLSINMEK